MEIRNTHILVRVIRFQSLLSVVYLWYNGLETEICDVTKPVHFQWAAGIPCLAIRVTRYKPAPTLIKGSRSEVTLPIVL